MVAALRWLVANIPKQFRRLVTIDGKRTVEADFSSSSIILYADKELEPPEDAHSVFASSTTRWAKQAFTQWNAEAPMYQQEV